MPAKKKEAAPEEPKQEETKGKPSADYPISFSWVVFRPDNRQYRQHSTELSPSSALEVAVNVPLNADHLYNASDIIRWQISGSGGAPPLPALTVKGMKAVHDAFSEYFEPVAVEDDFDELESSEDGWDEDLSSETATEAKEDDPDWEEAEDEFATDSKDDQWDEDNEDW